jgi:hypothetical protein
MAFRRWKQQVAPKRYSSSTITVLDRFSELFITIRHNVPFQDTFLILMWSLIYWSEFLATDSEAPGSIPGHYKKRKVVGLEQGPLSLVSATEELFGRK